MPSAIVWTLGGTTRGDDVVISTTPADGFGNSTETTFTSIFPDLALISGTSLNLPVNTQSTGVDCPCVWGISNVYWIYKCGEQFGIAYPGDLGSTTAAVTTVGTEFASYVDSAACFKTALTGHPDTTCSGAGSEFAGSDDFGVTAGFNGTTGTGKWSLSFGVRHNQENLSETFRYSNKTGSSAVPVGVPGVTVRYEKTFSCSDLSGSPISLTITSASSSAASSFGLSVPSTATATPVYT